MGLFNQLSQQQQNQQQQSFQGLGFGSLLGGGFAGGALGQAPSTFQSVFQSQNLEIKSKPKEKPVTFYCRLKEEITDWLKINI